MSYTFGRYAGIWQIEGTASPCQRIGLGWLMLTKTTRRSCHKCRRRMLELDYYGERLKGCPDCNVWVRDDGSRRKIPEHDIAALKAVREKPSRGEVH